jgi:hypothetical protein
LTIDDATLKERRQRAIEQGSWADYHLFIPTIDTALRYYRNKLVTILNDDEITKSNELLKNDLFEILRVIQNALDVSSSKDQEMLDNPRGKVFEYRNLISTADDIKHSKGIAAEKLNSYVFTTADREINAVSQAIEYIDRLH